MKIAILIGVSLYNTLPPLPACKKDVENMKNLIVATKSYQQVECITDSTSASQVKGFLRVAFEKYKATKISEVLIYFSSHGVFKNDALFCCSDFDETRVQSTSISNSELDELLRSIKPDVAVKIIDACQSGTPYIKDASDGFEKAIGSSQFSSFICMASCNNDQPSYAQEAGSDFTSKWIDAVLSKGEGVIYYRDIQAEVADAFSNNAKQTPYFVSQGSALEKFCEVTDDLRLLAAQRKNIISSYKNSDILSNPILHAIEEEVDKLDKQYVNHEDAIRAIEKSKIEMLKYSIENELILKFYNKDEPIYMNMFNIPKSEAVASFAVEKLWNKKYFIKVITEERKKKVPKDRFGLPSFYQLGNADMVEITEEYPVSIKLSEELPLEVVKVVFSSNHPSLVTFHMFIGIVHSLTEVMVLSSTVSMQPSGWNKKTPDLSKVQWRYDPFPWTDIVSKPSIIWMDAFSRTESEIVAYLQSMITKENTV